MRSYRTEQIIEEYRPAYEELRGIVGELTDFEQRVCEHGWIDKHLQKRGAEVMRQLYQCYLNRVSAAERKRAEVVGEDGQVRCHARMRRRELMSVFGEVEVCRLGYSDHGVDSVFPLDARLNLPVQRYRHGLRERVAEAVAGGCFEAAVEQIDRHSAGHIPKRC